MGCCVLKLSILVFSFRAWEWFQRPEIEVRTKHSDEAIGRLYQRFQASHIAV